MEEARYIIVGGGAFGASTAYNLARRGARDVVLLDRFEIGSQTSSRAAGLTSKVTATELHSCLADEAVEHLARFEDESGHSVNFHRSGSLKAALTPSGEERLQRDVARAVGMGIRAELISHQRASELAPFFSPGRSRAVLYCPEDAWIDPERIAIGFAARAADAGVVLRPNTPVTGILHQGGQVIGVQTERGEILAPIVVDAAGAWSRLVAEVAGIRVPLVPTRHQLYITEPIPGVQPLQPIVRILEPSVYVRHDRGGLLVGGYEDEPRQVAVDHLPSTFQISDLPLDFDTLRSLTGEVQEFFPALRDARIREHRGGLPTLTPDGHFIVGPVPNLAGFYIISGCNVGGLSLSPALGRALADLIIDGRCEPDLRPYYVERFGNDYQDADVLSAACAHTYARKYIK